MDLKLERLEQLLSCNECPERGGPYLVSRLFISATTLTIHDLLIMMGLYT